MHDLLVVVPSRGRPESAERLIDAFERTCRGDTHLLFGLDDDDPTLERYQALERRTNFVVYTGLRYVVGWINQLAVQFSGGFRYVGTLGDDNVPQTVGWDVRVAESLARQGTGMCFADDRYPRDPGSLAGHVFMTSNIVQTLGYMGPPVLRHMYVDAVWTVWGKTCSIEFLDDVVIEHLHPTCGKAAMDETYRETNDLMKADYGAFALYMRNSATRDIAAIRDLAGSKEPVELDVKRLFEELEICRPG